MTLRTALESYSQGEALQTKIEKEKHKKDESLSKMCIRIYNDTLKIILFYNFFKLTILFTEESLC